MKTIEPRHAREGSNIKAAPLSSDAVESILSLMPNGMRQRGRSAEIVPIKEVR